jgi:hypothetical protein
MSIHIRGTYHSYGRSRLGETAFLTIDEALDLLDGKLAQLIKEELNDLKTDADRAKTSAESRQKDYLQAQKRAKKLGVL